MHMEGKIPRKRKIYFKRNILRYSPNYTKEQSIEQEDKELLE